MDLVGSKDCISSLKEEYLSSDPVFLEKASSLSLKYSHLRRIRPDGNCFFRSLAYRYFEILLNSEDTKEWDRFKKAVEPSKEEMNALGFPSFTVEDFYDNFMDTLDKLKDEKSPINSQELIQLFNDSGMSDYIVVFLRLLTSKQLQKDCEFYQNFMEGGRTVAEFCASDVEPMYRESDHIHIIALTAATGINIRILYLDRGSNKEASPHDFPEGSEPIIHLLYKPGHYDILYPK